MESQQVRQLRLPLASAHPEPKLVEGLGTKRDEVVQLLAQMMREVLESERRGEGGDE